MTAPFRGCRFEVYVGDGEIRWSRHSSYKSAWRAYREAVNNQHGDHTAGKLVELRDVVDGVVLAAEATRA